MPVIDGKVRRARFTSLKLRELSSVDNPAQIGARMAIMKRDFSDKERARLAESGAALPDGSFPIENVGDLKNAIQAIGRASDPGKAKAHIISRARALGATDQLPEDWKVKKGDDEWPCLDALNESIRSIVGDASLTGGEKEARISASVEKFLSSVTEISPEVLKQREVDMPKTVEELQAELTKVTGELETSRTALAAAEKAKDDAMADKAKADDECKKAKDALAAATEETLKVGDVEVKKSEVGEAQFKLVKGLQDDTLTARLEKRASEEYPHVVGTAAEKALILKSIEGKDAEDPTRKAVEALMTACEKMTAAGFAKIGAEGGATPTEKAAQATFEGKVSEIEKRDGITHTAAMSKARAEFPAEFAAAFPEQAPIN